MTIGIEGNGLENIVRCQFFVLGLSRLVRYYKLLYKNSSGDEIANVNFLTTIAHT